MISNMWMCFKENIILIQKLKKCGGGEETKEAIMKKIVSSFCYHNAQFRHDFRRVLSMVNDF